MAPMTLRLMMWSLRRLVSQAARRGGIAGIALAVLVPAAALAWAIEFRLRDQLAREQQATVMEAMQAATQKNAHTDTGGPLQDLNRFESQLPAGDERMQVLADLFELASKHQLVLSRGEYQLQHEDMARLGRFRMMLPIKGDPAAIQRFVQDALAMNRALAFDALALKREQLNSQVVEAKVQLSLFVRLPASGAGTPSVVAGGTP